MNYGLYLSASGVLTNLYRQDVFANNLANAHTVGFKPDLASVRQRLPESVEDSLPATQAHALLDRIGGGVFAGPQHINFNVGPIEQTHRPLDVALTQSDTFFNVQAQDPNGRSVLRFTRDGRFDRDPQGYLITAAGHRVLSADGAPIELPLNQTARITHGGRLVNAQDETLAVLGVTRFLDPSLLVKQGDNLFQHLGQAANAQPADTPAVAPGAIENSGVDPIRSLMDLIAATKAVQSNGNLIRYHDSLLEQAVSVLGRVA